MIRNWRTRATLFVGSIIDWLGFGSGGGGIWSFRTPEGDSDAWAKRAVGSTAWTTRTPDPAFAWQYRTNNQIAQAGRGVWMDFVFMGFGYMMWNPRYPNANVNGDFWVKRTTSTVSWSRR